MKDLSKIIKEERQKLNLKQSELAERVGITLAAISNYEQGTREPKIGILIKLADEFDIPLDQLVGRQEKREKFLSKMEVTDLEEQRLVQMFREISSDDQQKVLAIVKTFHDLGKMTDEKDFHPEKSPASAG